MKRIILSVSIMMMTSCATQNTMMAEYREITKDVCRDNPHEIVMAQHLYNKMKQNN